MADGWVVDSSVWPLSQGDDDDDDNKQPVGGTLWLYTILSHPFYFFIHTHTLTHIHAIQSVLPHLEAGNSAQGVFCFPIDTKLKGERGAWNS